MCVGKGPGAGISAGIPATQLGPGADVPWRGTACLVGGPPLWLSAELALVAALGRLWHECRLDLALSLVLAPLKA